MAWGKRTSDDLLAKLTSGAEAMYILPFRTFGPTDAETFAKALSANTTLKEFYASNKAIGVSGARAFGNCLRANTTLTSLCIGDEGFGDEAIEALCEGLKENSGLVKLDLEGRGFTSRGAEALAAVTLVHPTLSTLLIPKNAIASTGFTHVASALASRPTPSALTTLNVSACQLDAGILDALASWIMLPSCSLTSLIMSNNDFSACGAGLGSLLGSAATLTSVDVSSCNLTPDFLPALCAAAGSRVESDGGSRVEVLRLDGNVELGPSVASLPALLTSATSPADATSPPPPLFPGLRTLSLHHCGLGDDGASGLVAALPLWTPALHTLTLSKNGITCGGAVALAGAVPFVKQLSVFHNEISDTGALALVSAAMAVDVGAVAYLDLGGNHVTDAGAAGLASALRACHGVLRAPGASGSGRVSLETLELVANDLTDEGEAALRAFMESGEHCGVDVVFKKRIDDQQ